MCLCPECKDLVVSGELRVKRTPTPEGVIAAANRIAGAVLRTPLLPFEWQGQTVWAKAECLQTIGAFKLRGATNRLSQLTAAERARGVVAYSSGNHAQGVALAAKRLGISATIIMPLDAPAVKREAVRASGAQIVDYDRLSGDREAIGADLVAKTGATLVPPFDDPDVIEGQGTVGLELAEQLREFAGEVPLKVIVPCGGGGLAAGIALAVPTAEILVVEPDGWDDMAMSIERGEPVPVSDSPPSTLCDALQTRTVSPLTLNVLRARGATAVAVSDAEVIHAVAFAARRLRLVVEPGGSVALAALLAGKAGPIRDRTVVVLSGGNVDPVLYAGIIGRQAAEVIR
jgi:threonine dehydratase